jgi:hypothetical protein
MSESAASSGNPPELAALKCIACNHPVTFRPDAYPLAFHCKNGHIFTLTDLLNELPPRGTAPLASTLKGWEERVFQLHELAGTALQGGYAFHAADLQEAANRIDQWLSKLQSLLSKGGPSFRSG